MVKAINIIFVCLNPDVPSFMDRDIPNASYSTKQTAQGVAALDTAIVDVARRDLQASSVSLGPVITWFFWGKHYDHLICSCDVKEKTALRIYSLGPNCHFNSCKTLLGPPSLNL